MGYTWDNFIVDYKGFLIDLSLRQILELFCYYVNEDIAEEENFCKKYDIKESLWYNTRKEN